jgi:hypothetical protein
MNFFHIQTGFEKINPHLFKVYMIFFKIYINFKIKCLNYSGHSCTLKEYV